MKSYELKPCEVELVVRALRYALKDTHTFTRDHADLCALIQKLDPQPVQKNAWMVVYEDGSKRGLFDTESEAEGWATHAPKGSKVVRVTWEE